MIALALARAERPARAGALAAAAAGLAVLDTVGVHRAVNPTAPQALFRHRPAVADAVAGAARVYTRVPQDAAAAARDLGSALERRPEGWSVGAALALAQQMSLEPLSAARWGLRGSFAIDYMNMQPAPLSQLVSLIDQAAGTPAFDRLLRVCGVTHVITRDRGVGGGLVPVAEFEGLMRAPVRVLAVPSARPRISVVGSARPGARALALVDPGFDPEREVLLDGAAHQEAPAGFTGAVERVVELERADRIDVGVVLSHPGFLVVLDAFDRGWVARVDGGPAEILRANHAFRAVAVPAGRHRVEMEYRPWAARAGVAVSGAALALLAAGAAVASRRRASTSG
jgi:hypothetical protein